MSLLSRFGFELREAVDGLEAFEIRKKWKPHLIWMDIRMPVMDGYESTKRIRYDEFRMKKERPGSRDAIIIAVSASAFKEEHAVALSKGCDDFLRKPFREEDILDMMSRHSGIRFVYEDDPNTENERKGAESGKPLTPEALTMLPDDVFSEFRWALKTTNCDATLRLIEEHIRTENEPLADALAKLVGNYRFDTLQELFGKGE